MSGVCCTRGVVVSGPPQSKGDEKKDVEFLYSTCASPVVPHPSTRHAHGCLASEIGRDPAFPTRYDRTELSLEAASLTAQPEVYYHLC